MAAVSVRMAQDMRGLSSMRGPAKQPDIRNMRYHQRQQRASEQNKSGQKDGRRRDGDRVKRGRAECTGSEGGVQQEGRVDATEIARDGKRQRAFAEKSVARNNEQRQRNAKQLKIRDVNVGVQHVVCALKQPEQLEIEVPQRLRRRCGGERKSGAFRRQRDDEQHARPDELQLGKAAHRAKHGAQTVYVSLSRQVSAVYRQNIATLKGRRYA